MLLVDDRIGSRDLLPALQRFGVPADLARLEAADFAFVGRGMQDEPVYIGVELKETEDLVRSLQGQRFAGEQLPKLQQLYGARVWLLTEGIWRTGQDGSLEIHGWHRRTRRSEWHTVTIGSRAVMRRDVESWLLTQTIRGGFHHVHCPTRADTIRWLAVLYHWWTDKTLEEHRSHQAIFLAPPDRAMAIEPSPFLKMAGGGLPGVGWDRALALEEAYPGRHFGSMVALVNTTEQELTRVEGIGKTTARKIHAALRGERG